MTTRQPIICGVDSSSGARRAALTARTLAELLHCELVLVHVVPPRPPMPFATVPLGGHPVGPAQMIELNRLESDAAFASVADELADTDAEHIIEHGHPAGRLSAVADARDAHLIVVGTRGNGAARSALLGSVSQELAAGASRPVVVVPASEDAPESCLGPGPVVCGVDGSEGSQAAAHVATRLADELHVALTLVSVCAPRVTGDERAAGLAVTTLSTPASVHVERLAIGGDPAEELTRAAADRNAVLLVVGSRGRGPIRAALLGSVSAEVTRRSHCPVLVVPPGAATDRASD